MPKFTPVGWKTLEHVFLAAGFQFARQEGSHRSYTKPGVARPVAKCLFSSFATTSKPPEFPATIISGFWNNAVKFLHRIETRHNQISSRPQRALGHNPMAG